MVMAETRSLPVIEEEEEIGDEFYEKIEAPKFVDFTAPDIRLPDDDRHWFCLRVGCDQKHGQELDSEAIYKNFVLRVMAARSPNVRLRKALNRRETSANLKCPLTAPAKSRVSRIALISSLSQKVIDNKVKAKPLSTVTASATPNAKVKQSSAVTKAFTTPRNQKKALDLEKQFRTVQSKKAATTVVVPKNRVVAKALVFHSPKKAPAKANGSVQLNTPMKALCSAMKKLELDGVSKNGEGCDKSLTVAASASRKQFRGREVKSRVFDSLYSNNNRNGPETNTMRCLKEKVVVKDLQLRKCQFAVPHKEAENDSSDMEIDEKSRGGSLERCPESGTSAGGHEMSPGAAKSLEENMTTEGSENEERRNPVSEKGKIPGARKRKDKENSLASDDKENEAELTGNDEKENASAPDENRAMITANDDTIKVILGSKHEGSRKTPKKSASTATSSQVVKYRKLKPTNPKPFKLRTDERGILKETNFEKRIPSPLKETTAKGGKAMRKHLNVKRKSETCTAQSEQDADNYNSCEERSDQTTQEDQSGNTQSTGFDNTNGKVQHKISARTPLKNPGPKLQKPIDLENGLEHQDKAAQKLDDNFKRKSQMMQSKVVRPRGALSRKKEKVLLAAPGKLGVITEKPSNIVKLKEASKRRNNSTSAISKAACYASRRSSRGRKAVTIPKEPKFQCLHVPKSCTRKLT